jgi:acyl-CoA dehydrogenase
MNFEPSPRAAQWQERVRQFFADEILPRNRLWVEHVVRRGEPAPFMPALQEKARAAGLWNLGLPDLAADEPGTRLTNLEYAPIAEILGQVFWASEAFNCQPPDVPNMITLQHACTPTQKARWLNPLLNAETRSAFAMTEPAVASSDATNIACTIVAEGDDYVINGRKWYSTGAAHPRCSQLMVMGVTDVGADRTRRHSLVMVPMDTPGVRLVRALRWMGCDDHVAPIGEIDFVDVRVPRENLLGKPGDGFKLAQVRLGPARVHHCMRSLGLCEVMVQLMMARAAERRTFGRAVIDYDTVQRWIAEARVGIEQARLLTLRCAWLLDRDGHQGAWRDVSLVKIAVPNLLQTIADRAIQVFGAMGGSDDTPIHQAFAWARLLRIGDGPDEVHYRQIFKMEAPPPWKVANSPYLIAHPD